MAIVRLEVFHQSYFFVGEAALQLAAEVDSESGCECRDSC